MGLFSSGGSSNMISDFLGGGTRSSSSSFSPSSNYSSVFSAAANYKPSYSSTPSYSAYSGGGASLPGQMSALMRGLGGYVPSFNQAGSMSRENLNYIQEFKNATTKGSLGYGDLPRIPGESWNDYMKRQETFNTIYSKGPGLATGSNAMTQYLRGLGLEAPRPPQRQNAPPIYTGGGMMMRPAQPNVVEFALGAPPEMKPLEIDYGGFQAVMEKTNLPPEKIQQLFSQYNLAPAKFNELVAAYNPTEAQISNAISMINDPSRLNSMAAALNRPYQEAFNRLMPMFEQNMGIANALSNQLLQGQIPQDVQEAVSRNAAVQRMQTGMFGGGAIGRNIVPRDLAMTSLDLQGRGANLLAQTGDLATRVMQGTMPVSGREFMVSPDTIYRSMRVSPDAIFQATTIPQSQIFQAYTVPASQLFNTYVAQAQYNQQIANQNLMNAWMSRPLPGQYVPGSGYVNFDGTTFSPTRPSMPGSTDTRWLRG